MAKQIKTLTAESIATLVRAHIEALAAETGIKTIDVMDALLVKEVTTEPAEGEIGAVETPADEMGKLFAENMIVHARWPEDGKFYPALIKGIKGAKAKVQFDDGTKIKMGADDLKVIKGKALTAATAALEAAGIVEAPEQPAAPKAKAPKELSHGFTKNQTVRIVAGRGKKSIEAKLIAVSEEEAMYKDADGNKVTVKIAALRPITEAKAA